MNWLTTDLWRGRRVLVTGASGFLGGWVSRILMDAGAEVHSAGHRHRPYWGTVCHQASLPSDADALMSAANPEVVFHLACPVNAGDDPNLRHHLRPGIVDATAAVIQAATHRGCQLIHAGTCAEYGHCPAPYSENQHPQPSSPYGELKWEASKLVLAAGGTVLRPFRAIGPGDHQSVVAAAARAALEGKQFDMTEGQQVREWNHVQAIAKGIVVAAVHPDAHGHIINIGGGEQRSVYSVVETIFHTAGAPKELINRGALSQRTGEVPLLTGNHRRAIDLWGEISQPSLDDTIKQAVNWMQSAQGDAA